MGSCPSCRAPVTVRDIKHFQLGLSTDQPCAEAASTAAWKAHGSKLNAVAVRLRKIREEDTTAKVIVFVQWYDIESRVAAALRDHGIPFLWLDSENHGQDSGAILHEFQTSTRSFVMLL